MALRLEIISAHRQQLGSRARFVLGDAGASIGRALDNDWALPDVSRFLSSHHAYIHYRGGEYFLEDTSSNGTFVNESVAPLGRRGTRALLHPGDVLRLGDYRILVHIEEQSQPVATPDARTQADMTVHSVSPVRDVKGGRRVESAGAIDFSALVRTPDASSTLKGMVATPRSQDNDLGDALNIESLLPDAGVALRAGYSGTTARPDGSTVTQNYADNAGDADSTQARIAEQERIARLRSAARSRLEGTSSLLALDPRGALDSFCRGMGIDAGRLPVQDEMQALQLAGRLLREALLGLKGVLRAQQRFVDSNGIERQAPEGRSPLEANMDEYLVELMLGHEKRKLDAVMRLRDQFAYASGHSAAIDPALRSALTQFLGHLAPDRLATGQDGAANWNRYKDVYGNLLTSKDGRLPHLFLEALALAYQDARGKDEG